MRRFTANVGSALALGLGLALALVWVLSRQSAPVIAAPIPRQAERPLSDATPTHYVTITGTDSSDCSTPDGACLTIQYAVDQAGEGDVIKMATGTYTGVSAREDVTQVVYISKTVTIQGGYTTTNWTTPYPITQPTTLDAQGGGRVIYVNGSGIRISPTLEGLCITGGNAAGLGGGQLGEDAGGGVYLGHIRGATLNRNIVTVNTATEGGGIYLHWSDAELNENTITVNSATYGGGVFLNSSSDVTLSKNIVFTNTAIENGGGLYLSHSNATLSHNTVASNTCTYLYSYGGGLCLNSSDATLGNNSITSNIAGYGGGLHLGSSDATLSENSFIANIAVWNGGGLYMLNSDATLINTLIANNRTTNGAGNGLYIWLGSSPRLLHTTLVQNSGGDGSGIYVYSLFGDPNTVALTNTILVSHATGIGVTAGSVVTLEATLWGNGEWANGTDWDGDGTVITGTHNYWGDPAFVDPDTGDYHITIGSAAINKGVNAGVTNDIDDDLRVDTPDIGADEWKGIQVYLPLALRDFH